MTLPPVDPPKYNREKLGYFGELGNGANARIRFLQSAITKEELDNITLIENIPGSEKWNIQDLFQRDVDMVRVESSILPYLKDPARVKFFNPLTLVLLPIDPQTGAVDPAVPFVKPVSFPRGEHKYTRYERDGLFSYEVHDQVPAYSVVRWNDSKVKLVAIDGQHRLSALLFWKNSTGPKDLDQWQIPVVILGVFRADEDPSHVPVTLLEIVRKTFVYINSRAEEVNEARLILLDDESVPEVCTQELVQASHQNDCLPDAAADKNKLPLLFFDWRGQVRWRADVRDAVELPAPGSVLTIVEIRDWFAEYILGDKAKLVLELDELDPPLSDSFADKGVLTHEDTGRVRKQCGTIILPGVSHLLEQFAPFRTYVAKVRELEKAKRAEGGEAYSHAFTKLRFGSHPVVLGQMKQLVDDAYKVVVEQLRKLREDCFDDLIDREIGKRGLVYAFAALKSTRDEIAKKTGSWKEHAEWFVPKINAVYGAGWFHGYNDLSKANSKIMTHICYDPSGTVINYKVSEVPKAFGSLLALLVIHEALDEFTAAQQADLWDRYGDVLEGTLQKGFRKEQRARLKDNFRGTNQEFIAKVNETAKQNVDDRLKLIRTKLMPSVG